MNKSSSISGFYKLSPKERLVLVKEFAGLSDKECALLLNTGSLSLEAADRMIENVVGAFPLPLGISVNFLINNPVLVMRASYDFADGLRQLMKIEKSLFLSGITFIKSAF